MASPIRAHQNSISDVRMSTVVPASITGEDKVREFTAADLMVKLHHITTVHFFSGEAVAGLSVQDLKAPMFRWLQLYYPICGRIRRHDGGRSFVKCNDSGVRIVEAKCATTVEEWLAADSGCDRHCRLVYHQPLLAQDLGFTPLVILQLTKFKCGGLSVGMRWAHVIGDAFSASECINTWGKIMANRDVPAHLSPVIQSQSSTLVSVSPCLSVAQLGPLGDNWLIPNNSKMKTRNFHITRKTLSNLLSHENKRKYKVTTFEVISAIVWKCSAKTRNNKIVTVCKKREKFVISNLENELPSNTHQVIGTVQAPTSDHIRDADFLDIAKLISEEFVDETKAIEGQMEEGNGNLDFLVYGSNLTFVDWEDVKMWGLEVNGRGPVFADASIGGVGDEGAVVVVGGNGDGRIVNVIMDEDGLQQVRKELMEYGIL